MRAYSSRSVQIFTTYEWEEDSAMLRNIPLHLHSRRKRLRMLLPLSLLDVPGTLEDLKAELKIEVSFAGLGVGAGSYKFLRVHSRSLIRSPTCANAHVLCADNPA